MARYRLSQPAQSDIESILEWSHANFGEAARRRYQALIAAAVRDVSADPKRAGCQARPELGDGIYSWHLRMSRDRSKAEPVQQPRHFLIYRIDDELVVIGRVLHDAMDLARHLHPDTTWEYQTRDRS